MIETTSFRLLAGVSDHDFSAVDARLQSDFAYLQAGLLRRTMTRSIDEPGRWQEFVVWASTSDADAAHERARHSTVVDAYAALVDHETIEQRRFDEIG